MNGTAEVLHISDLYGWREIESDRDELDESCSPLSVDASREIILAART